MSISIEKRVLLAPYTTLGIGGPAEFYTLVNSVTELTDALAWATTHDAPVTLLGGGSNLLIPDDGVRGLVVHIAISGVTYEIDGDEHVRVRVGAGVVLDMLIADTVSHEYWGLENLSGIPGTVGGVPIQNVGAYGVEAKDVIESVDVFDREALTFMTLTREACKFAYRDSIFKREGKDRYIVVGVTFILSLTPRPRITYKDLVARFGVEQSPSLREIRDAVKEIRHGKFPDWTKVGTAGSFFKNPIIDDATAQSLRATYPELPMYEEAGGKHKVAIGWVLDRVLNLRGYREGNVGLYEHQALVLVNHGGATCTEIRTFSDMIIQKIFNATSICVEYEVVVIE